MSHTRTSVAVENGASCQASGGAGLGGGKISSMVQNCNARRTAAPGSPVRILLHRRTVAVCLLILLSYCGLSMADGDGLPQSSPYVESARSIQPEGSALRQLVQSRVKPEDSHPEAWEIYYDPATGYPYYYHSITGKTQWENPFAGLAGSLASSSSDRVLRADASPLHPIYANFDFVGDLDFIPVIANRRNLPNDEMIAEAVQAIEDMAGAALDVAQEKLETMIAESEAQYEEQHQSWTQQLVDNHRVALAGAWNDLGNVWYARGQWRMCLDCFRRSLWWNRGHESTLLNLEGVLRLLHRVSDSEAVAAYRRNMYTHLAKDDTFNRYFEHVRFGPPTPEEIAEMAGIGEPPAEPPASQKRETTADDDDDAPAQPRRPAPPAGRQPFAKAVEVVQRKSLSWVYIITQSSIAVFAVGCLLWYCARYHRGESTVVDDTVRRAPRGSPSRKKRT